MDELRSPVSMLPKLLELQKQARFSLLATSRFIPDIVTRFREAAVQSILASRDDVESFVEAQLYRLPRLVTSNPKLQEEVKLKIVASVQGM